MHLLHMVSTFTLKKSLFGSFIPFSKSIKLESELTFKSLRVSIYGAWMTNHVFFVVIRDAKLYTLSIRASLCREMTNKNIFLSKNEALQIEIHLKGSIRLQ